MNFKYWLLLKEDIEQSDQGFVNITSELLGSNETVFLENDSLDGIIDLIKKSSQDGVDRSLEAINLTYAYLTNTDMADSLNNYLLGTDTKNASKFSNFKANYDAYKDFLNKVTVAVENNGYTSKKNYAWIGFDRIKNNPNAQKDDGTKTNKRYVSIKLDDLYKAISRIPTLAKELNKISLRPDFDMISFKIAANYKDAVTHADTIVIHFYDKMAKDQIDNAVQNFLNAAGVKESDRSNRQKFGIDNNSDSDSKIVANTFGKNLFKDISKFPILLNKPDLKQYLKNLIDQISMQSLHRPNT